MKIEEMVSLVPKLHLGTVLRTAVITVLSKFHLAPIQSGKVARKSAMKLPQQVRSQVALGNEGRRRHFYED